MSATATCFITLAGQMKGMTQGVVLIHIPKGLVVLTREEFIASLKRGKAWRRHEAFQARHAPQAVRQAVLAYLETLMAVRSGLPGETETFWARA